MRVTRSFSMAIGGTGTYLNQPNIECINFLLFLIFDLF